MATMRAAGSESNDGDDDASPRHVDRVRADLGRDFAWAEYVRAEGHDPVSAAIDRARRAARVATDAPRDGDRAGLLLAASRAAWRAYYIEHPHADTPPVPTVEVESEVERRPADECKHDGAHSYDGRTRERTCGHCGHVESFAPRYSPTSIRWDGTNTEAWRAEQSERSGIAWADGFGARMKAEALRSAIAQLDSYVGGLGWLMDGGLGLPDLSAHDQPLVDELVRWFNALDLEKATRSARAARLGPLTRERARDDLRVQVDRLHAALVPIRAHFARRRSARGAKMKAAAKAERRTRATAGGAVATKVDARTAVRRAGGREEQADRENEIACGAWVVGSEIYRRTPSGIAEALARASLWLAMGAEVERPGGAQRGVFLPDDLDAEIVRVCAALSDPAVVADMLRTRTTGGLARVVAAAAIPQVASDETAARDRGRR